MRCSVCGTETTELLKGKRIAVCLTCVETGRVKGDLPPGKIVFNRQVDCSFCGTEKTELFKSPEAAICRSCLERGKVEAGAGQDQRCCFCYQVIGTEKGIFGIFHKKTLQAARAGQDTILCDECLPVVKELAEMEHIKFHQRVMTALWHLTAR
jgi:hypothetical protein